MSKKNINKTPIRYVGGKTRAIKHIVPYFPILLILLMSSCGETNTDKYDRFMIELECPIILIGKTDKAAVYPSIVVRDAKGRVRTIAATGNGDGWKMPSAIADSRNIGDTLKPCN